jgi:hypothetical protein
VLHDIAGVVVVSWDAHHRGAAQIRAGWPKPYAHGPSSGHR